MAGNYNDDPSDEWISPSSLDMDTSPPTTDMADWKQEMLDEAMDNRHGQVQFNTGFDDSRQQEPFDSTDFTTPAYLDEEDWI